jgi:hypothetical protein
VERYSANISLIPQGQAPGKYVMWVSVTRWENDRALEVINLLEQELTSFVECAPGTHGKFAFLIEAADQAYQEIVTRYNKVCRAMDETNARPGSASTN